MWKGKRTVNSLDAEEPMIKDNRLENLKTCFKNDLLRKMQ